jgi:hypothetical protein
MPFQADTSDTAQRSLAMREAYVNASVPPHRRRRDPYAGRLRVIALIYSVLSLYPVENEFDLVTPVSRGAYFGH